VRDESLHCEGIIKLFHAFCAETGVLTHKLRDEIADICQRTVRLEDNFVDLAFEMGPVNGMTASDIKKYVRFTADWRMKQLGMKPIYMIEEHPLPWLTPLLNGVEHANFFEARATEYSKAATKGNWNEVWDAFDSRKGAKALSEAPANEAADDRQGGLLGVAAE
jgi:ribonucleoside-diphosphate reductase beta chain